jgi:predicted acetyltransferase
VEIRRLDHGERSTLSVPTQAYGFVASPPSEKVLTDLHANLAYYAENVTLVALEDGVAVAEASAFPMHQNVRGHTYQMAGVAGVASLPQVRRRGHVRAVLTDLLGRMRDSGHVVSALYPFRPSFYERFGYVGVPKTRTARFNPADLGFLLRAKLDGEIGWQRIDTGYDAYRDFTLRLLDQRHGFSVFPDYRAVYTRETNSRWLVTANVNNEVVAAVTYRISGHGGTLIADDLLVTSPLGRALLLQFLARHVDQVTEVEVTVPPDEIPELWATDLTVRVETTTSFPTAPAPMARVLSLDGLRGLPVGPGRAAVEIVDDPFVAGKYLLDGMNGVLDVVPTDAADVTLTVAGLSGLVYGVLDPSDVVVRGFGEIPADRITELARLFPRQLPYFFARF